MDLNSRPVCLLYAVLIACAVLWAYSPALGGSFIFDDVANISANELLRIDNFDLDGLWQAAMSSHSGELKRPVAMLSFAANHVLTGMDPWWMKLTNLLIHLFNGLLVYLVVRRLFPADENRHRITTPATALFISAVWLLHPINVTAVSYIVQRMTSLSATFVLLAVFSYQVLRQDQRTRWTTYGLAILVLMFWFLGLFTKENAILLSIYVFLLEWLVYGFRMNSQVEKPVLAVLWTLLATPWFAALCYVIYRPAFILDRYEGKDFSLWERLLTEGRIVVDYIRLGIAPDTRHMGLYHDNIELSTSFFTPLTTFTAFALITGLLVLAVRLRRKAPLAAMGVLWFFGGHILESSVLPLELKFLHRNYLPSIGILLVLAEVGRILYARHSKIVTVAALSLLLVFSASTRSLNHQWSMDFRMQLLEAMNNPDSPRANFRAGQILKTYAMFVPPGVERDKYRQMAIDYFRRIRQLDPGDLSGDMGILETYLRTGLKPPRALLEDLIRGFETAQFNIGMLNTFRAYSKCFRKHTCGLEPEDFRRMKAAITRNQQMDGYFKKALLDVYAAYLADHEDDIDGAIRVSLQGLMIYPNPQGLVTLVQYYERGGYYSQMEKTLEALDMNDRYNAYRKFTKDARQRLQAYDNSR